jgi:hypothetical protein
VPLDARPEFLAIGRGDLPDRVAAGVTLILDMADAMPS